MQDVESPSLGEKYEKKIFDWATKKGASYLTNLLNSKAGRNTLKKPC